MNATTTRAPQFWATIIFAATAVTLGAEPFLAGEFVGTIMLALAWIGLGVFMFSVCRSQLGWPRFESLMAGALSLVPIAVCVYAYSLQSDLA